MKASKPTAFAAALTCLTEAQEFIVLSRNQATDTGSTWEAVIAVSSGEVLGEAIANLLASITRDMSHDRAFDLILKALSHQTLVSMEENLS